MLKIDKKIVFALFFLIFLLFCYFRLKPIFLQTYPYTFDQGRDFLKAEEIVRFKNFTFLGPTSGIMGIYHGVWWYYFLSIPYILLNGHPSGFIFMIFLTNFLSILLFSKFLSRVFNFQTALFFLAIAANSPYLILLSIFAISSAPELPLILLLLLLTYRFFKKKTLIYQVLIFLSLGFIFETELPVGLFLVPAFFISLWLSKQIKILILDKKGIFLSFLALIFASIPRVLFELKNNFPQLKTVIKFVFQAKNHEVINLRDLITNRIDIFWQFFQSLFVYESALLAIFALILFFIGIKYTLKKLNALQKLYFRFLIFVTFIFFLLTFLYKSVIPSTYIEGFSYMYLMLLTIVYYSSTKSRSLLGKTISFSVIGILLFLNFSSLYFSVNDKRIQNEGIRMQIAKLNYLFEQNKNQEFCLHIYTPPVIPHTYDYLLSYYEKIGKHKKPISTYVNNQCWYVIEKEQEGVAYQQRIIVWRKDNIPETAKKLKTKMLEDGTLIEMWGR